MRRILSTRSHAVLRHGLQSSQTPLTAPWPRSFHKTPYAANITPLRKQLKDASKSSRLSGDASQSLPAELLSRWELTVGIEIHAQLNTARKLFSRSPSENQGTPNDKVSAFDIAFPGSQPLFQIESLIPAIRAALALNCDVQSVSRFDRKHYFYHDQPAGYQITQYYQPLAKNGHVTLTDDDGLLGNNPIEVGIKQIQLEQDTAKSQELEDGINLVDFTRAGQPLIEIISLPHIHSPEVASSYVRKIQGILHSIDAVTTGMELGGLRADVNVSVRRTDDTTVGHAYGNVKNLGQRTEIKNLSSFKAVEDAVRAERDRQIQLLESGGVVLGETRGWYINNPGETRLLRGKEGEVDYRYMPDPDIPPLCIGNDLIAHLRDNLPGIPEHLTRMLVEQYGLSRVDAKALIVLDDGERLDYFQRVVHACTQQKPQHAKFGKLAGNWVLHELGSLVTSTQQTWTRDLIPHYSMAQLIKLAEEGRVTGPSAKLILKKIFETDEKNVEQVVEQEGLWFQSLSEQEYSDLAERVINEQPDVIKDIQQKGKQGKIQFLIGQMMRSGERSRMEASKAEQALRMKIFPTES